MSYQLHAKKTSQSIKSFKAPTVKSSAKSSYQPKAPYAGFAEPSQANGRIKTKSVHGYFKPSNGYKFVNPYAKSKK
jgi:hypothetical protein